MTRFCWYLKFPILSYTSWNFHLTFFLQKLFKAMFVFYYYFCVAARSHIKWIKRNSIDFYRRQWGRRTLRVYSAGLRRLPICSYQLTFRAVPRRPKDMVVAKDGASWLERNRECADCVELVNLTENYLK